MSHGDYGTTIAPTSFGKNMKFSNDDDEMLPEKSCLFPSFCRQTP
jgi:hypothetical protein